MLCTVFSVYAQRQGDTWYFGDGLGLHFSNGEPTLLTDGAMYQNDISSGIPPHSEASSVICNSNGNLLFYTNGEKIWDRNHQVMPNGDGLLGHFSSSQGALIVPQPESDRLFHVFTTDDGVFNELKNGFRYSVVDMCLNDSMGDVVEGRKNILLLDTVAEKLSAVRHANGTDYWVVVHKYYSDAFYAYQLTSSGINDPVISKIGSIHPHPLAFQGTNSAIGQLKISPNGNRLAVVTGGGGYGIAELFNLNKATGEISNCIPLQTEEDNQQCYGLSFSPDNSRLYMSCISGSNDRFHQFDLLAGNGDPDSIIASKTTISYSAFGLQLANNGKIYVSRSQTIHYLDVIHEPNNLGLACNLEDSAIWLGGRVASMGLPNFIDSYAYTNGLVSCTEKEPVEDTLTVPSAITPDGDGINDAFEVEHLPDGSG
ncbi:MAG: hypothetical protein H6601_08745, partial [Flavobacteriales bacterium]|nr:hypothetical protein [Flavobacteriales bacterium]